MLFGYYFNILNTSSLQVQTPRRTPQKKQNLVKVKASWKRSRLSSQVKQVQKVGGTLTLRLQIQEAGRPHTNVAYKFTQDIALLVCMQPEILVQTWNLPPLALTNNPPQSLRRKQSKICHMVKTLSVRTLHLKNSLYICNTTTNNIHYTK